MKKVEMTENWRLAAILIPALLVLVIAFNFLILPRFQTWIMDQIPGSKPVYGALVAQYPQDRVSITSNLSYGNTNQNQRTLTITVGGKSFPNQNQLTKLETLVCSSLGRNKEKYNNIILQTSIVHQYLIFYSAQGQSHRIICK